ncbi:ECF transporter S component [Lactobacillus sp. ESL0684]|uniref:ECF transporter S component n=1 Tax=Lactobacillus sp. ESL0684 TaxID=2983213 RepID=UPI0023F8885C|nr:ECF transporter S component [Lactobacillus sp. ESL0684]WEV43690.1 ECF transporter S component [Lactobacillus sp. ESL0684]
MKHQQIKQIALLAILTAMCVTLRIFKIIPIPNVQPVTDILMLVTLNIGFGFGFTLAILTMIISNIYLGFGIWTISQILAYGGCILTVIFFAKITPLKKHFTLQLILATFLGWEYGFFVDLGMSIFGGIAAFLAYWASSLTFDTYHAIGNLVFYPILYKPINLALDHYKRRI